MFVTFFHVHIIAGYTANHVDIAPRHAGILMGITNTFANLTGFGAPYLAGLLIDNDVNCKLPIFHLLQSSKKNCII
jgi:hypothetical protein